jgi:outer membrane lipoprotein-sorting protein
MRIFLNSLTLFALFGFAQAAPMTMGTLMTKMQAVKSRQAVFSEKRTLQMLEEPLLSNGLLNYQYPNHLEKITRQPKQETLTVSDSSIILSSRGKTRSIPLKSYPALWGFVESIRATLAGDAFTLQKFYQINLSGEEQNWNMILIPKNKEMAWQVRRITLKGNQAFLQSMEVMETSGDESTLTISEIKK